MFAEPTFARGAEAAGVGERTLRDGWASWRRVGSITRVRRERGFGVNPWSTHTRFLVSHRLLIDEAYTAPLRDWLGDFRAGTLLILDEVHHAAPSSGQRYAIDSQITRTVRDLAPRFEHRLFLSATVAFFRKGFPDCPVSRAELAVSHPLSRDALCAGGAPIECRHFRSQ